MRRFKKATLTDVAQRAGVSVTTASYILNGRSSQMRISAATERRVQAAMRRPRLPAQLDAPARLRGSSTQTIGVISDFVASGDFSSRLLSGASAAARLCDHVIVIGETLGNPEVERLLVEEMLDRQVDGVLYATVVGLARRAAREAAQGTHRAAQLHRPGDRPPRSCVPDDVAGGRMAAEHLLAAGVARVGLRGRRGPDPRGDGRARADARASPGAQGRGRVRWPASSRARGTSSRPSTPWAPGSTPVPVPAR